MLPSTGCSAPQIKRERGSPVPIKIDGVWIFPTGTPLSICEVHPMDALRRGKSILPLRSSKKVGNPQRRRVNWLEHSVSKP